MELKDSTATFKYEEGKFDKAQIEAALKAEKFGVEFVKP